MTQDFAVGIDLGTTFSCVAIYRRKKAEIIPDRDGDRLIPSVVYFDPKSGNAFVGKIAEELSPKCMSNGLRDSKRILGRKFDDEFILRYTRAKHTQFKLVRGEDDMAAFEIEVAGEKIIKTPEEVSAEILKHLKEIASEYLGRNVTETVISIPAYFSNAQRNATKKAAELAGLRLLKLTTEPTAAAIHYIKNKHIKQKLLVFDWGGGTLDVSLIEVDKKIFQVKAVYGDTLLGGRNLDEILFDHFYMPVDANVSKFKRRLMNQCIKLKKQLSIISDVTLEIDRYEADKDMELHMTRKQFEDIGKDIFERAIGILELAIDDAGWSKEIIQDVILVGGSTRIPKIREQIRACFPGKKLKTDLNPDEAVAAGASFQATILKNKSGDLEYYKVTEVTPLSLGTDIKGHLMSVFIPKNSPLPAIASAGFVTTENDQKACTFKIFEGERKNTTLNNKLGELIIYGLPQKRAGDVKFSVTFNLDENGILTVTATEISSNATEILVVTMGEFRLSERKIKMSLQEAKKLKHEDDVFEKFILEKNRLHSKCNQIIYDLSKISSKSDQDFVKEKCQNFIDNSNKLDFTESETLKGRFKVCYDSILEILQKNGMLEITNG